MEKFTFVLVLPIIFILLGLFMGIVGKPERINWWAGYRMPRTMKNQETWVFANSYFGKLLMLSGCITLTFSIGAFIQKELLYWALGAQGIAIILCWVFTEIALRKEFNKNGERRK